jgi:hypothetical protein
VNILNLIFPKTVPGLVADIMGKVNELRELADDRRDSAAGSREKAEYYVRSASADEAEASVADHVANAVESSLED